MRRLVGICLGAFIGLVLAAGVGGWRVRSAGTSIDPGVDPSQRARILAQRISEAMNFAALFAIGGLFGGGVLGAVVASRRPPNPPAGGA